MKVLLSNQKIKCCGRYHLDGDELKCAFSASGFEFSARLSGGVTVNCEIDCKDEERGGCLIGVMINDDFENMTEIVVENSAKSFTAVENLPNGDYIIRIVKLNEFNSNTVTFKSVECDGELLDKPSDKPLKFEFYGDSLTCGYGNLSSDRLPPTPFNELEHAYRTYAAFLAREFNAEISVCAQSGYGILHDYDGGNGVLRTYYNMALPLENVKWNFDNYKADAVFINIGSNDFNFAKNSKTKLHTSDILNEFRSVVDDIRVHNPECKLIFNIGISDSPIFNEYCDLIEVYEKITAMYDNAYFITNLQCNQLGGNFHPNVDDHRTVFKKFMYRLKEQRVDF